MIYHITVLEEGLSTNFAEVKVEVVDCPDLTQKPFLLSASGIILFTFHNVYYHVKHPVLY